MPRKKKAEKPLTLGQLADFYDSYMEPRFKKIVNEEVQLLQHQINQKLDELYKAPLAIAYHIFPRLGSDKLRRRGNSPNPN